MGVTIESITPGDGKTFPKRGDTVAIHYVGTLVDGKKFDSSRDRNSPFLTKIGVGQVIKGWDEGVPQLSLGQKAVLTVTSDYVRNFILRVQAVLKHLQAYGARGFPPVIPPNSTLRFEVELLIGIHARNNLLFPYPFPYFGTFLHDPPAGNAALIGKLGLAKHCTRCPPTDSPSCTTATGCSTTQGCLSNKTPSQLVCSLWDTSAQAHQG